MDYDSAEHVYAFVLVVAEFGDLVFLLFLLHDFLRLLLKCFHLHVYGLEHGYRYVIDVVVPEFYFFYDLVTFFEDVRLACGAVDDFEVDRLEFVFRYSSLMSIMWFYRSYPSEMNGSSRMMVYGVDYLQAGCVAADCGFP